jgi:hypothetical protein
MEKVTHWHLLQNDKDEDLRYVDILAKKEHNVPEETTTLAIGHASMGGYER